MVKATCPNVKAIPALTSRSIFCSVKLSVFINIEGNITIVAMLVKDKIIVQKSSLSPITLIIVYAIPAKAAEATPIRDGIIAVLN